MKAADYVIVIMSLGFILIGLFVKKFYWATGIVYTSTESKQTPTWIGQAAFIGIGLIFLLPETIHLLSH